MEDTCSEQLWLREGGKQAKKNAFLRWKKCFGLLKISKSVSKNCKTKWQGKYWIYILVCLLVEVKNNKMKHGKQTGPYFYTSMLQNWKFFYDIKFDYVQFLDKPKNINNL
jgi:hypothetical protein